MVKTQSDPQHSTLPETASGAPRRVRIDRLLVERGLFESRARAQAALAAGLVRVDGVVVAKPSTEVEADARIEAADVHDFVSRGALKLTAGLDAFGIAPAGMVALDVGASTGGFTEVLLRRGARRVYAVDVGRDQFHPRLAVRPEVRLMEGTDIRALGRAAIPEPVDLVVVDVSFISLALVLPAALAFAGPKAALVALVKPQFEAGRAAVRKGVVRDAAVHEAVCARVAGEIGVLGWRLLGRIPSPIEGGDGNREFLVGAGRP
ncbi:TlyA family RNA methyltransferase [Xanthobacter autotrophicus]|uniref:TlyA family RNA methyltransferase n=1 Tax=Xanthobacter TaxID=279 RepID=UPI0024AB8A5D|nr:TlyA family RNA methyltransferase [Xanthobacter autotrophicus]MDI4666411.1 TlyA family RNA methyltransferase [Xanthobacter autotrophicus]